MDVDIIGSLISLIKKVDAVQEKGDITARFSTQDIHPASPTVPKQAESCLSTRALLEKPHPPPA